MRYKFNVSEDGKTMVEKEAMSFKKLKKSLFIKTWCCTHGGNTRRRFGFGSILQDPEFAAFHSSTISLPQKYVVI